MDAEIRLPGLNVASTRRVRSHTCVHENNGNEKERKALRDALKLDRRSRCQAPEVDKAKESRPLSSLLAIILRKDILRCITFCRDISLRWENKHRNRDTGRKLCLFGRGRRLCFLLNF